MCYLAHAAHPDLSEVCVMYRDIHTSALAWINQPEETAHLSFIELLLSVIFVLYFFHLCVDEIYQYACISETP